MSEDTEDKKEAAPPEEQPKGPTFAEQVRAARPGILAALDALEEQGAEDLSERYDAHDNATDRLLDLGHLFHVLVGQLFQHKGNADPDDDWRPRRYADHAWADLLRHAEISVEVSQDYDQASVDGPALVQELASIQSPGHLRALLELVKKHKPPNDHHRWDADPSRCVEFLMRALKEREDMDADLRDRQNYNAAHTLACIAAASLERQLSRVDRQLQEATEELAALRALQPAAKP